VSNRARPAGPSEAGFGDRIAAASVIKSELIAFGVPTSVKPAPDYAIYLADISRATTRSGSG
jgi:hypothetical protein